MGIHPKIGITGLPRSGKSAVLDKVVSMVVDDTKLIPADLHLGRV